MPSRPRSSTSDTVGSSPSRRARVPSALASTWTWSCRRRSSLIGTHPRRAPRRRPLGTAEEALVSGISERAVDGVLPASTLKAGAGAKLYGAFKKDSGAAAKAAGYFRDDPNSITGRWVAIGIGLIVAVVAFGF